MMNRNLELFVAEKCPACLKTEEELSSYAQERTDVNLEVINISEGEYEQISIVPALFVENVLFSYGEIDFQKLTVALSD